MRASDVITAVTPSSPVAATARARRLGRWIPPTLRVYLAYLAAFALVYSPVLFTSYGIIDDYYQLATALHGATQVGMRQHISFGRPLQAILVVSAYSLLHGVDDLRWLRLVGIAGIALLAWLLQRVLAASGRAPLTALLVPLLIGLTMPFQVWAAWAICAFFPIAATIAGAAYLALESALRAHTRRARLGFGAATVFLLVSALAIYQPAAMVFWVVAAIRLLTEEVPLRWIMRAGGAALAAMCVALALAYGLFRAVVRLWLFVSPVPLYIQRAQVTADPARKLIWFAGEVLVNAANLLQWKPSALEAVLVYAALAGGLALYFSGSAPERLGKLGVAVLLLPLCHLPNLITAEDWASYRTQVALTSLIVVYVAMAFTGYVRLAIAGVESAMGRRPTPYSSTSRIEQRTLVVVLAIAACVFGFVAATSVYQGFARPQQIEYALLRQQLRAAPLAQAHTIYVLGAHYRESAASFVRYDEYGMVSSWYANATKGMTYLALRDDEPDYDALPVVAIPAYQAPSASFPPGAVVINLHLLKNYRLPPS